MQDIVHSVALLPVSRMGAVVFSLWIAWPSKAMGVDCKSDEEKMAI
jgi:hypothetical protein